MPPLPPLPVALLRPGSDRPAPQASELLLRGYLTTEALAVQIDCPLRSVRRWAESWAARGELGIVAARGRGRGGVVYLVDPGFPARYLEGLVSSLARCG